MGGDYGSEVSVSAVLVALEHSDDLRILLYGDRSLLEKQVPSSTPRKVAERLRIFHAESQVFDDESPARAMRHKRSSSMAMMLQAVVSGEAEGAVSAGNTGALMALSRHILGTFDSLDRPAIISHLPRADGRQTFLLDLGANVGCDSELLYQFAQLGRAVASSLASYEDSGPKVALLNIGSEAVKGNDQVKAANELLVAEPGIDYVGYVEGSDLFNGSADVVVCDGFVGNVALKTIEGLARYVASEVDRQLNSVWWQRLLRGLLVRVWRPVQQTIDPSLYSGALLAGVKGLVVKTHGGSSSREFALALNRAREYAAKNLVSQVENQLIIMES